MAWYDYVPGGSMINSFLHPEEGYEAAANKMQDAWKQAQQYGQQGVGYQEPYRQAGIGQTDRLNTAENQLLDPSALLSDWMNKYQASPFAQKSMANAKEAGLGAASSMGLMGSSAALNNIQQSSSDIMNADRQQFLTDLMQKYMSGIGIGQSMFGTGAATAGNIGNQMSHMGDQSLAVGENMGQAAYGSKNAPGNLLKDMLALGAKAYMASQGGGAVA